MDEAGERRKPPATAQPLIDELSALARLHYKIVILEALVEEQRPLSITELTRKLGLSQSTISKEVLFMNMSGLVKAEREGRRVMVKPTEKGLRFLMLAEELKALLGSSKA